MRFQSALLTLVVVVSTAVASSPLPKRDDGAVLEGLNAMQKATDDLRTASFAFPSKNGTLSEANDILTKLDALRTAIIKENADANASPPFTESLSAEVVAVMKNIAQPFVAALRNLDSKKPTFLQFAQADLVSLLGGSFTAILEVTDSGGWMKISSDQQGNYNATLNAMIEELHTSITVFS
ncbi:hypothetical protein BD410DRAFT_902869 [Rickenella mellea]|uniref:Hydrophobic surface binding protein A n=1 Tax=Rickenella mellea TaxID=50990 RepID=A0A4Y7PIJ3_9AGAM|nr:hypothetical protein BD410DRAFT_902869 [Rickenella mellea]